MGHIKFNVKNSSTQREKQQEKKRTRVSTNEEESLSLTTATTTTKKQRITKEYENFSELKIADELKRSIKEEFQFDKMTRIQAQTIPVALEHSDVDIVGNAKTGSGKTLAFLIPCVQYLIVNNKFRANHDDNDGLGALILAPTRELAIQIHQVAHKLINNKNMKTLGIRYACVMGGANKQQEIKELKRGVNLLVATPGRLLDHLTSTTESFQFNRLKYLVLDEADMLIDIGFEQTIRHICSLLPKERTTFLFSATLTAKVDDLAAVSLRKNTLKIGFEETKTVGTLEQLYIQVRADRKYASLVQILRHNLDKKVIVFLSIKLAVEYVSYILDGFHMKNIALHGDMKQEKRTQTFMRFMNQKEPCILIATDVAARGLDFPNVDLIVQVDIPEQIANYFHRIGRTARAGKSGVALLMLTPVEVEVCLPTFNNYFAGLAEEDGGSSGDDVCNNKKILQPYPIQWNESETERDHKQIQQWVKEDDYMYATAPKIANTLSNVFNMYSRKYGFKHNQFDFNSVKASVGMMVVHSGQKK
jgi:ATP-dependent RNA helicase DDX18/HAS1